MSTGAPWLTIVVPAYNAERYLDACISSISPGDNDGLQVVLVDDGSTDATPAICDRVAAIYANVVSIHKENGGSPSARNAGFAVSEGTWVWFVDADDLISPSALNVLKRAADSSLADAIQIRFLSFLDGEEPVWPAPTPSEKPKCFSSEDFLSEIYRGHFQHHMCSFLLRTETLRRGNGHSLGPFREDFSLYDDVVATESLIRQFNSIDVLKAQLYGYRQTSSSITHKRSDGAADSGLRAVREISRYHTADKDANAKLQMEIGLLFTAYKLAEGTRKTVLKQAIQHEIEARVAQVGRRKISMSLLARYLLMKTRALDLLIHAREVRAKLLARL